MYRPIRHWEHAISQSSTAARTADHPNQVAVVPRGRRLGRIGDTAALPAARPRRVVANPVYTELPKPVR